MIDWSNEICVSIHVAGTDSGFVVLTLRRNRSGWSASIGSSATRGNFTTPGQAAGVAIDKMLHRVADQARWEIADQLEAARSTGGGMDSAALATELRKVTAFIGMLERGGVSS